MFFTDRSLFLAASSPAFPVTLEGIGVDMKALQSWCEQLLAAATKAQALFRQNAQTPANDAAPLTEALNGVFNVLAKANGLLCVKPENPFAEAQIQRLVAAKQLPDVLIEHIVAYAAHLAPAFVQPLKSTPTMLPEGQRMPFPETAEQVVQATIALLQLLRDTYDDIESAAYALR
ncbi:hypothetical protein [Propionivibrio limicola]|uniref:hypothetical protein n=1 Tax=Propionivibrio limicola TaxID=167645 RepID=UPI0012911D25|nr:hypothetical protein [Propionivibrio limicola]